MSGKECLAEDVQNADRAGKGGREPCLMVAEAESPRRAGRVNSNKKAMKPNFIYLIGSVLLAIATG